MEKITEEDHCYYIRARLQTTENIIHTKEYGNCWESMISLKTAEGDIYNMRNILYRIINVIRAGDKPQMLKFEQLSRTSGQVR